MYNKNKFYKKTSDYISSIDHETGDWSDRLKDIKEVYEKNKEVYQDISEKSGYLPPELIAAIHYRENTSDYLAGTFDVYLHNGDTLGEKSMKEPYPDIFAKGKFKEAAIDALSGEDNYFYNKAKNLYLTPDSKDLTAMVAFSVFYNGWDTERDGLVSYAYNGTDLITRGTYTSDHHYDPNAEEENLGTYLVLKELLDQKTSLEE